MYQSSSLYDSIMYGNMISEDICLPMGIIDTLIAIIFPPLAVFIKQYRRNFPNPSKIGIAFILTAMFYFPGLIYALNETHCSDAVNTTHYGKSDTNSDEDLLRTN